MAHNGPQKPLTVQYGYNLSYCTRFWSIWALLGSKKVRNRLKIGPSILLRALKLLLNGLKWFQKASTGTVWLYFVLNVHDRGNSDPYGPKKRINGLQTGQNLIVHIGGHKMACIEGHDYIKKNRSRNNSF